MISVVIVGALGFALGRGESLLVHPGLPPWRRIGRRPLAVSLAVWLLASGTLALAATEGEESAGPAAPLDGGQGRERAPSAEVLIQRGVELRKAGADRAALEAFERAFSLEGSPRALAQMALAEQALGLWREAHEHLRQALSRGDDAWILEHRTILDSAWNEIASQLGALELSCNVAGADVWLDGRMLGQTPLAEPVPLVAGANVIQVTKAGYFEVARQVYVDAGRLSRLNVVLTPNPSANAPGAGRPGAGAAEVAAAVPAAARDERVATSAEGGPFAREVLLYTSLGLTGLGLSIGVTGYVLREVNVAQYNDDQRCGRLEGTRRSEECADEAAAFRRGEILAIAGFSGAAVFGLMAAYLWWDRPQPGSPSGFACALGFARAACQGHF